jgi:hypothetical protein
MSYVLELICAQQMKKSNHDVASSEAFLRLNTQNYILLYPEAYVSFDNNAINDRINRMRTVVNHGFGGEAASCEFPKARVGPTRAETAASISGSETR